MSDVRKRGLAVFLLISFGATWGYWFVARLVFDWSLVNPLVQVPAGFMPAIAAIVVRRWVTREGFADAGHRLRFRAARRLYLVAWLGPLGVAAVVVALATAMGRSAELPNPAAPFLYCLLALATTVLFWGEEHGWTGYLLLRVCPGRPRRAALVAGLVAAVWHWPLAFLGYAEFDNMVRGLLVWTLWIMCQEVVLAWLRARSGSIWPACLAHAGNNMILVPLTTGALVHPGGLTADGLNLLTVLVLAAVAVPLFLRSDGRAAPAGG